MLMTKTRRLFWLVLCISGLTIIVHGRSALARTAATLRAGAATSNITPRLGISINGLMHDRTAAHIHDELHARCLVLEAGGNRIAIVVCDSCMIPREVYDAAKEIVRQKAQLPVDKMLMCATHTHSAPTASGIFQSDPDPQYQRFLTHKIADAVLCAINNLSDARVGWGIGRLPQHVFNRRWKMKGGAIGPDPFGGTTDQVLMNPPVGSPDLIEPAGPTDPDVLVLSVQHRDGRPLALVANYALHYVGGTGSEHISADYFGVFADVIQQRLGGGPQDPPFVVMLSNGCSADINNINFRGLREHRQPYEQMRLVATDLAEEVHRVYESIRYSQEVELDIRQTTLKLGVRLPSKADIARAEDILAAAKGPVLKTRPEIYARETVLLSKYPQQVDVILQTLQINDLGIVAIPCEVFVEIGMELKSRTPFRSTFVFQLANGYNGYLPTVKHHKLGGYETWRARSSYLEVEAAPKITKTVLQMLGEIHGQR